MCTYVLAVDYLQKDSFTMSQVRRYLERSSKKKKKKFFFLLSFWPCCSCINSINVKIVGAWTQVMQLFIFISSKVLYEICSTPSSHPLLGRYDVSNQDAFLRVATALPL